MPKARWISVTAQKALRKWLQGGMTKSEICRRYGIARSTLDRAIKRHEAEINR